CLAGVYQSSHDYIEKEGHVIVALGKKSVVLSGGPREKDEEGTGAYASNGIVQEATRVFKKVAPGLLIVADTCLCEYTSQGHCGVLRQGGVDNDASLLLHAKTAVSQAEAGADIIAPSNITDGFVVAIRQA